MKHTYHTFLLHDKEYKELATNNPTYCVDKLLEAHNANKRKAWYKTLNHICTNKYKGE